MPMVGGKKYSYDKKGIAAAKKAAIGKRKEGISKPYPMKMNEKK